MNLEPLTRFTFDPDFAAVTLHGQPAKSQTHSQASGGPTFFQTGKLVEDPFLVGKRDPRAVILHPHLQPFTIPFGSEFDLPAELNELGGVFQQD